MAQSNNDSFTFVSNATQQLRDIASTTGTFQNLSLDRVESGYKYSKLTAYSGASFGTIVIGTPQFLVTSAGATPSTSNRAVLPSGAIVNRVVITPTTALAGAGATLDFGYQAETDTAAEGNDELIAVATLTSLDSTASKLIRDMDYTAAAGTEVVPLAEDNVLTVDANTAALTAGAVTVEVWYMTAQ